MTCAFGSVDFLVPDGTMVVLDGTSFLASARSDVAAEGESRLPRIEITATTVLGRVKIVSPSHDPDSLTDDELVELASNETPLEQPQSATVSEPEHTPAVEPAPIGNPVVPKPPPAAPASNGTADNPIVPKAPPNKYAIAEEQPEVEPAAAAAPVAATQPVIPQPPANKYAVPAEQPSDEPVADTGKQLRRRPRREHERRARLGADRPAPPALPSSSASRPMTGLIGLPPLVGVHALVGNLEGISKRDRSADFAPTGADRDPHSLMLKLVRPAQRNGEAVDQLITSETVSRRRCDHELVATKASHDVVGCAVRWSLVPTRRSRSSPAPCPWVSLTALKPLRSRKARWRRSPASIRADTRCSKPAGSEAR